MTVKNDPLCLSILCAPGSLQFYKWSSRLRQTVSECSVKTADGRAAKAPQSCPLPLMTSYKCLSCVFAGVERSWLFSRLWDECGGWRASHNRVCLRWEAPVCVHVCVVTNTGAEQDGKCEALECTLYECVGVFQCVLSNGCCVYMFTVVMCQSANREMVDGSWRLHHAATSLSHWETFSSPGLICTNSSRRF